MSDDGGWVRFVHARGGGVFRARWEAVGGSVMDGCWVLENGTRVRGSSHDVTYRWSLAPAIALETVPYGVWLPIACAPREPWEDVPCCWEGQMRWAKLCWKLNGRTGRAYWGDPEEMDDYALADAQPTHWMRLPEVPGVAEAVAAARRLEADARRAVECPQVFDMPGVDHA